MIYLIWILLVIGFVYYFVKVELWLFECWQEKLKEIKGLKEQLKVDEDYFHNLLSNKEIHK